MIKFVWDENKNKTNRTKHGVWFEEAQIVFEDINAILYFDKDHSIPTEDRYILLGQSDKKLLVVIHVEINNNTIRIISARKATKKEKKVYEKRV